MSARRPVMWGAGTPYRVFTPFYRKWSQMPVPPAAATPLTDEL